MLTLDLPIGLGCCSNGALAVGLPLFLFVLLLRYSFC